jgi:hypothetical protein
MPFEGHLGTPENFHANITGSIRTSDGHVSRTEAPKAPKARGKGRSIFKRAKNGKWMKHRPTGWGQGGHLHWFYVKASTVPVRLRS